KRATKRPRSITDCRRGSLPGRRTRANPEKRRWMIQSSKWPNLQRQRSSRRKNFRICPGKRNRRLNELPNQLLTYEKRLRTGDGTAEQIFADHQADGKAEERNCRI